MRAMIDPPSDYLGIIMFIIIVAALIYISLD